MRVELEDVSFRYDEGRPVLSDINLTLDRPGLACIIGPNGVGKSTLIKCINRILKPTSGRVLLDGEDVSCMTQKKVSELVSYVPVRSDDAFAMTVFDTVMIGRHNMQGWRASHRDVIRVHRALEALGIDDLADRNFDELSAGQHQKVAIARGLAQETGLLMLDEPTSNLDIKHQMYVTELLRDIAVTKGITVLMISHNLGIAAKYADTMIMMAEPGVIHSVGTPEQVITPQSLREVYGVDCDVVVHQGRPAILYNYGLE